MPRNGFHHGLWRKSNQGYRVGSEKIPGGKNIQEKTFTYRTCQELMMGVAMKGNRQLKLRTHAGACDTSQQSSSGDKSLSPVTSNYPLDS